MPPGCRQKRHKIDPSRFQDATFSLLKFDLVLGSILAPFWLPNRLPWGPLWATKIGPKMVLKAKLLHGCKHLCCAVGLQNSPCECLCFTLIALHRMKLSICTKRKKGKQETKNVTFKYSPCCCVSMFFVVMLCGRVAVTFRINFASIFGPKTHRKSIQHL